MQLGRLLSVLAGLGVLMTVLSLSQLISGIYSLMYPLRWLGLPRERFAVRLALTLENAESAMRDTASDWKYTIGDALKLSAPIISPIEIRQQRIKAFDVVLFAFGIIVTVGLWR